LNGVDAAKIGGRGTGPASIEPQVEQMQSFRNLVRSEGGATAIEYALIASMIAMAIVVGFSSWARSSARRTSRSATR